MYTVELFKADRRVKTGERFLRKVDHSTADRSAIVEVYEKQYPASKGFRFEIYKTFVIKKDFISGTEFEERYDTPYYCSPSSETYWSS